MIDKQFKYKVRKKEYMKVYWKQWSLKNSKTLSEKRYKYRNSEKGFLNNMVSSLFSPSKIKTRGFIPESTKEEIKNYFYGYVKKYGRICFYCFEPWTYIVKKYKVGHGRLNKKFKHNLKNLSLDRIDNSETYSVNNIIFCCTECNSSKNKISIKLIKRLNKIIEEKGL
jgi:5-methylcytosine-specific restriction endonuclease McrA